MLHQLLHCYLIYYDFEDKYASGFRGSVQRTKKIKGFGEIRRRHLVFYK